LHNIPKQSLGLERSGGFADGKEQFSEEYNLRLRKKLVHLPLKWRMPMSN